MTIGYFFGGGLIKPISDQELSQISSVNSELIDKATDYENMINYKNRIDSVLVLKKNEKFKEKLKNAESYNLLLRKGDKKFRTVLDNKNTLDIIYVRYGKWFSRVIVDKKTHDAYRYSLDYGNYFYNLHGYKRGDKEKPKRISRGVKKIK